MINRRRLIAAVFAAAVASDAFAQGGPITKGLRVEPPPDYAFRIGPLMLSPNLQIKELGLDSNVFDKPTDEKRDFVFGLAPDFQMYAQVGAIRFVGATTTSFQFFKTHKSERGSSREYMGRVDLPFSRFKPYFGAALMELKSKPNREIDLRARRTEREVAAGIAFEVSPVTQIGVDVSRMDVKFAEDQPDFDGVNLATALNSRDERYAVGWIYAMTPLTKLTVSLGTGKETFLGRPDRTARRRTGQASLTFGSQAVLQGSVGGGFEAFDPVDPNVPTFRGIVLDGSIRTKLLDMATLAIAANRRVEHSYRIEDAYYIMTNVDVTYTQRIFGPIDAQVRGFREWQRYADLGVEGRDPAINTYHIGIGYNKSDSTRFGINYEYAERRDADRPDRRYTRRRFFGNYTYELR